MSRPQPSDHLEWHTTEVGGRRVNYGVGGEGPPVLFLHGWALGSRTYKRGLKRVIRLGYRVYSPALPGFGGTERLPGSDCNFAGFAAWADAFLDAVGVTAPVVAVGHSFGGAVGIKLTRDHPDRVARLVLINSVGGAAWNLKGDLVRSMAQRPLWDWAVNFSRDLVLDRSAVRTLATILCDAVPNIAGDPLGVCRAAGLARRADLTSDLAAVASGGTPVQVIWGDRDSIITKASFESLCSAAGCAGEVVPGRHSWLLSDPDAFGETMARTLASAVDARGGVPARRQARAG